MNVLNKIWPWSEIERLKGVVTAQDKAIDKMELSASERTLAWETLIKTLSDVRDQLNAREDDCAALKLRLRDAQRNDTPKDGKTGKFKKVD